MNLRLAAWGVRALAAAWACAVIAGAFAEPYPSKPVRLVDPYVPGGSTDVVSRALAAKFGELTGQPMWVDHRPGAGSNIGSDLVAKSAPDGYTLLLGTSSLAINPGLYRRMPFDPLTDLAPVCLLIRAPNVLAVQATLPVRTLNELLDYARSHPGQLSYGSSGNGATNHLAMEQLKQQARIDMVHVPFKGGGEAMSALLGGQTQLMFNPASTIAAHEKGGRIRAIAVASRQRMPGLDVPTLDESGLSGFEAAVWFGLFAPAATPPEVVRRLNGLCNRALDDPTLRRLLEVVGMQVLGGSPDDLHKALAADAVRWGAVARAAHVRLD
jgi:tripartite-type tricarboxylate transporter receptor subunit TctC